MQAVQSAHILTIRAGLATEALRVGAVLDGQLLLVENDVAVDVGHGHLSRRNQVEVIYFAVVHLSLLVGQLTRAIAAGGIHHRGRHDLGVATGTRLIQEEVDQGALQTGSLAFIDGESGSGNLHTQVEVDDVVLLSQLPVGQCILRQLRLHATHLHHQVVLSGSTFGHLFVGHVGDSIKQLLQLCSRLVHLGLQRLIGLLELGHLVLGLVRLSLLALLHQLANALAGCIHLSQVLI